jgi:SAM-dependent methyltransferase
MHLAQIKFLRTVKRDQPQFFQGVKVLDCGSLDLNGNNRQFFDGSDYTGVDLVPGPNVDIVCPVHELNLPDGSFDVVISGEMLEHDRHHRRSLRKIYDLVRPGGLLLITCATDPRQAHGVDGHIPHQSPGTNDYYQNIDIADIDSTLPADLFRVTFYRVDRIIGDLYMWGVKHAD